jgi:hypothetical protein
MREVLRPHKAHAFQLQSKRGSDVLGLSPWWWGMTFRTLAGEGLADAAR